MGVADWEKKKKEEDEEQPSFLLDCLFATLGSVLCRPVWNGAAPCYFVQIVFSCAVLHSSGLE